MPKPAASLQRFLLNTAVVVTRLVTLMILMWYALKYHDAISNFVGSHFPWPNTKALKWPALLTEVSIIEVLVCIPLVYPIALVFGRASVVAALLISSPVVLRAIYDISSAPNPPFGPVFVAFLGFEHLAFLVVGVAIARHQLKRSKITVEGIAKSCAFGSLRGFGGITEMRSNSSFQRTGEKPPSAEFKR